jgi:hypothetical protein
MTDTNYSDFFNAALALFPLMVLTKTISFRNRPSTERPSEADKFWRRQFRLPAAGHSVHVVLATAGEIAAIIGIWGQTKGVAAARVVAMLLIFAAIPLVIELLRDATRP